MQKRLNRSKLKTIIQTIVIVFLTIAVIALCVRVSKPSDSNASNTSTSVESQRYTLSAEAFVFASPEVDGETSCLSFPQTTNTGYFVTEHPVPVEGLEIRLLDDSFSYGVIPASSFCYYGYIPDFELTTISCSSDFIASDEDISEDVTGCYIWIYAHSDFDYDNFYDTVNKLSISYSI